MRPGAHGGPGCLFCAPASDERTEMEPDDPSRSKPDAPGPSAGTHAGASAGAPTPAPAGAAAARPVPEPVRVAAPVGVLLVLSTAPDEESARRIAAALVEERLAACVSVLAPCSSVYRWQGAVETAEERPLLIKTATDRYPALQARLRELHPYELPEILCWRPDGGLAEYAAWVIGQTRVPRRRVPR